MPQPSRQGEKPNVFPAIITACRIFLCNSTGSSSRIVPVTRWLRLSIRSRPHSLFFQTPLHESRFSNRATFTVHRNHSSATRLSSLSLSSSATSHTTISRHMMKQVPTSLGCPENRMSEIRSYKQQILQQFGAHCVHEGDQRNFGRV